MKNIDIPRLKRLESVQDVIEDVQRDGVEEILVVARKDGKTLVYSSGLEDDLRMIGAVVLGAWRVCSQGWSEE